MSVSQLRTEFAGIVRVSAAIVSLAAIYAALFAAAAATRDWRSELDVRAAAVCTPKEDAARRACLSVTPVSPGGVMPNGSRMKIACEVEAGTAFATCKAGLREQMNEHETADSLVEFIFLDWRLRATTAVFAVAALAFIVSQALARRRAARAHANRHGIDLTTAREDLRLDEVLARKIHEGANFD